MVVEQFTPGELTVPGCARRANVAESVVRHAIARGALPVIRRWGRVLVREEDLARFVASRERR